jgi:hypothetical protein
MVLKTVKAAAHNLTVVPRFHVSNHIAHMGYLLTILLNDRLAVLHMAAVVIVLCFMAVQFVAGDVA